MILDIDLASLSIRGPRRRFAPKLPGRASKPLSTPERSAVIALAAAKAPISVCFVVRTTRPGLVAAG